jgi:Putative prokaryotic signal transducing protein
MNDLIVVRTFPTMIDAELAKSTLDAADIDSFIQADDVGGMRPHMLIMQGARLVVRAEDAERADSILQADGSSN